MSLNTLHQKLGWPKPSEVWNPTGTGPRIFASLADRKIGDALRRHSGRKDIRLGILSADSSTESTEQPLAVVCEFQAAAAVEDLREVHRLAWNFSRTPILITLEPHILRVWTCCEPPAIQPTLLPPTAEIAEAQLDLKKAPTLASQAAQSLHWLEFLTGTFFKRHALRFKRAGCADRLLLDNLSTVRAKLLRQRLRDDTSHDLLARLIFIKFLFDRRDSAGTAALNTAKLKALHKDGVLAQPHADLASLLNSYDDTYALFRWLDNIFNGDLFPGKGQTRSQREAGWRQEMAEVAPRHLKTIADFVGGRLAMRSGQGLLWPQYSFDAIPLEFISSIYEEFVTKVNKRKAGTVFTPPHVVDFVLDEVLPWDDTNWNVRVLDPACGSGIFLVKTFQRLVYRWRLANREEDIKPATLRSLMEKNLFGVDIDPHAVRVASFSLYLAMCDEIDPKQYWTHVRFPRLRGVNLVQSDFFSEDTEGIRSKQDAGQFDIVVGNAPWGDKTIGDSDITKWQNQGWKATYDSIGPLFLAKSAALLKPDGRLSMLQPAGLLFNEVGTAQSFRRKLFASVSVQSVVNLSALRFQLFPNAIGPACIITFRNVLPDNPAFTYVCPKSALPTENDYRIIVEAHDIHVLDRHRVIQEPVWWTALMWGSRRDVALVQRLEQCSALHGLSSRGGIILGDQKRRQDKLLGRRILDQPNFPDGTWLKVRAQDLPKNENPWTDSAASTNFSAFELPQLVIKQSWTVQSRRFEAAMVESTPRIGGILCSRDYITVHGSQDQLGLLEAACLVCNSSLAVYFLFLTSHRLASYRPNPNKSDWMRIPVPKPISGILDGLTNWSDVDRRVIDLLRLTPTDRALIEDAVNVTFADFKGDGESPGRATTRSERRAAESKPDPILISYCEQFVKVLQAAFGRDKTIRATVFQEDPGSELPVRLVAIHLGGPGVTGVTAETVHAPILFERLQKIGDRLVNGSFRSGFHRIARVYDPIKLDGQTVPTVYIVKPDRVRYWTRSVAIRDADEVSAEFLLPEETRRTTEMRKGAFA
jgi:hypothetical protein